MFCVENRLNYFHAPKMRAPKLTANSPPPHPPDGEVWPPPLGGDSKAEKEM